MKRILICVLALAAYCSTANAQSIIDADEQQSPNDFYTKVIVKGKKAMPFPAVRESDVIWESVVWRTIDLEQKFNQFFYYPFEEENNTQGRTNLVNLIYHAVERGEIIAYDDDDLEKALDPEEAIRKLNGNPFTIQMPATDENGEPEYDEEGDLIMKDSIREPIFNAQTATKLHLKEKWYIDKQDTRQKVRIIGLAFSYIKEMQGEGSETRQVPATSFWIRMDDMRVRDVLVKANAYDEHNDVKERSYDDIFIQRYFDSFITRQSNIYNRSIADYYVGDDAILESQRLEDEIFNLESDMWEY